jgi:pyruvate dehydrogenase E2 component (dihydrolipoamide acetyltransferase)
MALFEFKLPDIGEGVSEGEVVAWNVKSGDVVREDDPMVEVMTDKATVTIGAPKAGTIKELRFSVGQIAKVGQVLVVIDTAGGAAGATATAAPAARKAEPAATAVGDIKESLPGSSFFATKPAVTAGVPGASRHPGGAASNGNGNGHGHAPATSEIAEYFAQKPLATPATRKLARDLDVDLRRVPPTGAGGRVTKDDVRAFAGTEPTATHGGMQVVSPAAPRLAATRMPSTVAATEREERKPFVGIRRKIAERMQMTKNTAAHFTFVEECDCTRLIELRDRLRPAAAEQGVKLSYLPFITKAVVSALRKHPQLNAALDESKNELVTRHYYDIGIAAATHSGLMVPVVRDADRLTILDLAREIDRLGDGARAGTLKPSELTGSTFTITSLGKQGGLFATPILNHPEVGILGVHQMKERPVVRNGQIAIGTVMLLSLSFDHRIVDGHVGAAFAYEIIGYLENPERFFLEMV